MGFFTTILVLIGLDILFHLLKAAAKIEVLREIREEAAKTPVKEEPTPTNWSNF